MRDRVKRVVEDWLFGESGGTFVFCDGESVSCWMEPIGN